MKKISLIISVLIFVTSCVTESNKKKVVKNELASVKKQKTSHNKSKIGKTTYTDLVKRTHKFADNLDFDLNYIRKKGLKDKKYLAEFLGMYWKLKKALKSPDDVDKIQKRLEPFYKETLKPNFHNMATVNDKLFKANSMSYMRIMWLLQELGFDISLHKKELAKVQKRMDNHMVKRGAWQRAVFDKYYDFFKIEKPVALNDAKKLKGPIKTKQKINYYKRVEAYNITHFIFAAYDYGKKKSQSRFSKADIDYLKDILPKIIQKFELKNNDDLVGELLTCQILIGDTKTEAFKKSYQRLMRRQNQDGSFGSYERARKKYGKDLEFRYYMHTTLVCFEAFVEFEERKVSNIFE